jgi:hypothetical protein
LEARVTQLTEELGKTDDAFEKVVLRNVIRAIDTKSTTITVDGLVRKYSKMKVEISNLVDPTLNLEMDAKRKKVFDCVADYNQSLSELEELEKRARVASNIRILRLVEEYGTRAIPQGSTTYHIAPDFNKPNPKKQRIEE